MLKVPVEGQGNILSVAGYAELVEGFETDVDIPVLEEFVIEVFLCEIRIQGQQGAVFAGGIGKVRLPAGMLVLIFRDFLAGDFIVCLRGLLAAHAVFYVGAVHVGLGEVRIEGDGHVVVFQSILPAPHFDEVPGPVEICQHVAGIDAYHPVHIVQCGLIIPDLSLQEAPVIEGEGVARFFPQHPVQILHGGLGIVAVGIHQGAVEVGESIGGIQLDGKIEV